MSKMVVTPRAGVLEVSGKSHGFARFTAPAGAGCAAHHLHGTHGGRMRVTGAAPDKLVWEFGLRRSYVAAA